MVETKPSGGHACMVCGASRNTTDEVRSSVAGYHAAVSFTDDNVGQALTALDELGAFVQPRDHVPHVMRE